MYHLRFSVRNCHQHRCQSILRRKQRTSIQCAVYVDNYWYGNIHIFPGRLCIPYMPVVAVHTYEVDCTRLALFGVQHPSTHTVLTGTQHCPQQHIERQRGRLNLSGHTLWAGRTTPLQLLNQVDRAIHSVVRASESGQPELLVVETTLKDIDRSEAITSPLHRTKRRKQGPAPTSSFPTASH